MRKFTILWSVLALMLLTMMPVHAQDEATASVRVAHLAPDAPAVDVYVDGELTVEGLVFTEVTPFLELAEGTYSVAVTASGASVDNAVIGPVDLTLEAESAITVAAVGSIERETLTATVIEEDYSPISAGNARITVVHAIEGESALDIYGSGIQLIQALRYPSTNGGDGAFTRDVPVGRYNFEANVAESDATVRVANGTELEDGEYYLIVALGPQANEGELLIVTPEGNSLDDEMMDDSSTEMGDDTSEDDEMSGDMEESEETDSSDDSSADMDMMEGSAMVRVAHFVPDAPAVDVYVDGELVVEGLEFPEVTAFLGLAGDTYSVAVTVSGASADDAVIGPIDLTLEDESYTTVAAVGSLERETITATVIEEDYSPIPTGSARITVVHAIEGESALDIYGSGIQLIQALRYPATNAGDGAFTRDVPVGRYNFEANVAESDATVRVANGTELEDGEYYLIVALGPQANEGDLLVVTPEGYENDSE